ISSAQVPPLPLCGRGVRQVCAGRGGGAKSAAGGARQVCGRGARQVCGRGGFSIQKGKQTPFYYFLIFQIKTIEEFSLEICKHFLTSFDHVTEVKVHVREAPWKRMEKDGERHVHAFIYSPEGVHTCDVEQKHGGGPVLYSGIEELRVLKTTQSGFVGFLKDRFTTLPEVSDRCFSTIVNCRWKYNTVKVAEFDTVWAMVKETILDLFAGPPNKGEYSPSVQKTLYDIQKRSLKMIPEIEEMELILPNKHYFTIDLSKLGLENQDEILLPSDIPYGNITGTVRRAIPSKL
uniref:Uricase n=1 Tax=Leptobrachium leishanense TaxID=445787 RepID=A0A8C5WJF4_9ANUR